MANAAEQSVELRSIFVLKRDEWFENFDPTVSFFVRLAAEKLKNEENESMRRRTVRRSDLFLQWNVITASISFAFAWESSGAIDDWRTKREISSRRRFCSGRSDVSCSRYSNSWFVSLMFKQIYMPRIETLLPLLKVFTFQTFSRNSSFKRRHLAMFRIDPRSQPRVKADRNSLIQEFSSSSNWKCSFVSSDMIWKNRLEEKNLSSFRCFSLLRFVRPVNWNSWMVIPIYQIIIAKWCSTQFRTENAMEETIRPKLSFEHHHLEKKPIKAKISWNEEK